MEPPNTLNVHATAAREGDIVSVMINATGTELDFVHLVDQLRWVTTEHSSAHALVKVLESLTEAMGRTPRARKNGGSAQPFKTSGASASAVLPAAHRTAGA